MSKRINSANRRYHIEFGAAMMLYIAVVIAAKFLSRDVGAGVGLTLLAIAPVIPVMLACVAFFRLFSSLDERERRLAADAAAMSLVIGIFAALTLGFLESFEVFTFEGDILWLGPFLIMLWGLFRCILIARR